MYTINPKGAMDIDLTGIVIRMLCAQAEIERDGKIEWRLCDISCQSTECLF
jgi:hypothetical protein